MACAAVVALPAAAQSDPYATAVQHALDIVSAASPGDTAAAERAAVELKQGTGETQPEILDDLTARPPDLVDAKVRLTALVAALNSPVDSSDPAHDRSTVQDVLAMHRYDALHQPPGPIERFLNWLWQQFLSLLASLGGAGGLNVFGWLIVVGVAAAIVALILVFVTRGGLRRAPRESARLTPQQRAVDLFAEADRLAAGADYTAALRALCAAVAAALGGESTWGSSPLTVREIFNRSTNPAALRPLLIPFEAAFYGGRAVDRDAYGKATAAADPFRARLKAA